MELHVTGELETKLAHSAAKQGRRPDELVQDVLTRYFEEETRGAGLHGKSGAALVEAMRPHRIKTLTSNRRVIACRCGTPSCKWPGSSIRTSCQNCGVPGRSRGLLPSSPIAPLRACISAPSLLPKFALGLNS